MFIKLLARNVSKIAKTFADSNQNVYYDVEVLTVKFHELSTFHFVIGHLSNRIRFLFFAQVSFDFNFLDCELVMVDYFGQFVLDQSKHLRYF